MRQGIVVVVIAAVGLGAGSAGAQEEGSLVAEPTSGEIGTEITIDGECPNDAPAGDAVALYRVADDALVDVQVQLGIGQPDPTTWQTTLVVQPRLDTTVADDAEPTNAGHYELRLLCEIGSSFRAPAGGGLPPGADVPSAVLPFTVGASADVPAAEAQDEEDDDGGSIPLAAILVAVLGAGAIAAWGFSRARGARSSR